MNKEHVRSLAIFSYTVGFLVASLARISYILFDSLVIELIVVIVGGILFAIYHGKVYGK